MQLIQFFESRNNSLAALNGRDGIKIIDPPLPDKKAIIAARNIGRRRGHAAFCVLKGKKAATARQLVPIQPLD